MKTKITWLAMMLVLLTVALAHAQGLPTPSLSRSDCLPSGSGVS